MSALDARPMTYPIPEPPEHGAPVEVAEGVLWLRLPLPMALDHVNVYLLDDGDGWTVIDTGMRTRRAGEIWQSVLDGALKGKPVHRVVVTHHHPDHVGFAGWFKSRHGAEVVSTRTAWLMARMLTLDEHAVPTSETLDYWRSAGMPPEMIAERADQRPFNFADIVAPLPLGFRRIAEGDHIRMASRDWVVRIGHGHAPEHATFWSEDGDLVICGDQILPSISPNLGVYATEPDADPVAEWIESSARLASHADARHLALPGHNLPFRGVPTRLRQLIDNHTGALERLVAALDEPRTAVDCFDVLFRRSIGAGEYGLALVEAMAHMNHLLKTGKITRSRATGGAWMWKR